MIDKPICEDCLFYKRKWFKDDLCMKYAYTTLGMLVNRRSKRSTAEDARYFESRCGEKGSGFVNKIKHKQDR